VTERTLQRRWFTTAELAARWKMSEFRAEGILNGLHKTGHVEQRGDYWRASSKALRLRLELEEIVP
jgi:hypothetical protein